MPLIENFMVVGCGHIGRRHCEIIHNHPNCKLTGLVDLDEKATKTLGDKYSVPTFKHIEIALDACVCTNVVTIATPNYLHVPQAITALRANKHVVIEKPIGLTAASCREMIEVAKANRREIFCVVQNRFTPAALWLKQIVSNNRLGKIAYVQINCFWNRDDRYYKPTSWRGSLEQDGGTLYTQFSHFVDMMVWLFGDINSIKSTFYNNNHQDSIEFEDTGSVSFQFNNGGIGSINFTISVWDSNYESSIIVIGEKGSIKIGGQYMNTVDYCNIENYEMPALPPANPPNEYGGFKGSASNHYYVYQDVVNTLNGGNSYTNASEALMVIDIIERIYRAGTRPIQKRI